MKVIRVKETKEYLNCFQSSADDTTLYQNAALLGYKDEKLLEIVDVTEEEYKKIVSDYKKDYPVEEKPDPKVVCDKCGEVCSFELKDVYY